MLQIMAILGAVIRRCNAVLSGGLVGVDALGEKVCSNFVLAVVSIERPRKVEQTEWDLDAL